MIVFCVNSTCWAVGGLGTIKVDVGGPGQVSLPPEPPKSLTEK